MDDNQLGRQWWMVGAVRCNFLQNVTFFFARSRKLWVKYHVVYCFDITQILHVDLNCNQIRMIIPMIIKYIE